MKSVTIAEFKRNLPSLLVEVAGGDTILLQKGRNHENVAILAPVPAIRKKKRKLGILEERGNLVFKDWEMTEEEFLGNH